MDINRKALFALLSAYVKGENTVHIDNDVDFNKMYELASIHSVQGIIFTMLNKAEKKIDKNTSDKFKSDFLFTVRHSMLQEAETEKVISLLNTNGIKHVLYKGYVIRNYYPDKELRTMGDVDILIEQKDRNRVHTLLLSNGFEFCDEESDTLVWNYSNKNLYLEVHTKIMHSSIAHQMTFSGTDYGKYFSNAFNNTIHKEKYTYELSKEYHFLYILVHIAKHFYHVGAGIRMFLDLSIFSHYCNENMDWNYIAEEIKKLDLEKFAAKVFNICNKFLGGNIPLYCAKQLDASDLKVIDYITDIGTFGYNRENDNPYDINFGIAVLGKHGRFNLLNKLSILFKLAFPSADTLLTEDESKLKLPFAWVKRWYKVLFKNKKLLRKQLSGLFTDNDSARYHAEMLEQLGLTIK